MYSFFYKPNKREDVPLLLSKLKINNNEMERSEHYIDNHSLLSLYHSYMHSYINYGNIAWRSAIRTKICSQQKHAIQIVYSKDRLSHIRELFMECKVLNVYQVNIGKILFLCIKLTQILHLQFFGTNLKSPLTITQQTSLELIIVYHILS